MKCMNCGSEIEPGALFCGECGADVNIPVKKAGSLSNGIALGVDEKIVRHYVIGRYTFGRGSTEVIVTNKRVIRYEDSVYLGMQNNQMDEINLDAVHGVATRIQRSISIVGLIVAAILLVIGLTVNNYTFLGPALKYIAIGLSVIVLFMSFKPKMSFFLYGSVGGAALITEINGRGKILGKNDQSAVFQFKPTDETKTMMKELGACIYDLKTLGDAAIELWSK